MEVLYAEVINLAIVIIVALVGIITQKVTAHLNRQGIIAKIQSQKELAKIVVNAIEQTYQHLEGAEKLELAKADLIKIANEKGIKISDIEVDLLIENAVKTMKDAVKQGMK